MGILNILTFVFLIAGISSPVIGDEDTPYRSGTFPAHLDSLGFPNTTLEDIEKFDQAMCTQNGGPSAHDTVKKSFAQLKLCVRSLYEEVGNELNSTYDEDVSLTYERETLGVVKFCQKERVSRLENCLRNTTESSKICLDVQGRENAEIIHNVTTSLVQFICENDAARFKAFTDYADEHEMICVYSKERAIRDCADQTIGNHIRSKVSSGAAIGGLGIVNLFGPIDLAKCTILEQFQNCTVGVLNECKPSVPADVVNSAFNLVKKVTTCNVLLGSQANPANLSPITTA